MFDQNGGFQAGAYDIDGAQPTSINWTRQSSFTGPRNPKIKWKYVVNENIIHSCPVIGKDNMVYFGDENGNLYSVQSDGQLNWTSYLGGCLESPAIGRDGTIYIGSRNHKLYAVHPDGTIKWEFRTGEMIEFSPALSSDGMIYISSHDRKFYAIDPDGKKHWEYASDNSSVFWSSAAIGEDGTIYVCVYLYLLSFHPDGRLKWKANIGGSYASAPVIDTDGTIYIEAYLKNGNMLQAITSEGKKKWEFSSISSSPAMDKHGTLYGASNSFKLYAVDRNGQKKWDSPIHGFMYYPPLIDADGVIYAGTSNNKGGVSLSWITAINPDGTTKWEMKIDGTMTSPALGDNGILYALLSNTQVGKSALIAIGD